MSPHLWNVQVLSLSFIFRHIYGMSMGYEWDIHGKVDQQWDMNDLLTVYLARLKGILRSTS